MNRLVIENSISSLTVSYCRSYLLVLCANGSDRKAEMLMERTRPGYIGGFFFLEAAPILTRATILDHRKLPVILVVLCDL